MLYFIISYLNVFQLNIELCLVSPAAAPRQPTGSVLAPVPPVLEAPDT